MLARLQIHWPWPNWIIAKLGVWIAFGGLVGSWRRPAGVRPSAAGGRRSEVGGRWTPTQGHVGAPKVP